MGTRTAMGVLVAGLAFWMTPGSTLAEAIPRSEHPRPDFRRETWVNLNGRWQFRFDPEDRGLTADWATAGEDFDGRIVVPFCWQSRLSGIEDTSGQKIGWYRRTVSVPKEWKGRHVWLCFGAVDWEARVWVNGKEVGRHEGGYTPFEFDITELAAPGREITIVVRAFDATDPELPLGKQVPSWYTATSGIWQTVWLEARPDQYVAGFRLTPRLNGQTWTVEVELDAAGSDGPAELELSAPEDAFPKRRASLELKQGHGRIRTVLGMPSPKPWSPEQPHLFDLDIRLVGTDKASDTVHTYFGLRTIERGRYGELPYEVILLNGKPIYLRGALDQSFNPEGIYTAPSDEFMRRDMEIARSAGLNFLRVHIKSEEPRRLYWADRLGVLIMEDMPSTYKQTPRARQAWEQTMLATIARDRNHPAIIAWCLFNETWGLGGHEYKKDRDTQDWVLRMWTEVKEQLDATRPVEDNSPCLYDHVKTDVNSWHFYIDDYARARRHIEEIVEKTYPGSPLNYVPGRVQGAEPLINSEYGSVSARGGDRDISWGFRYLTTQLRRHGIIQGYVYTELTDIEWEHNGLVNYDRSPKEFGYDAFVPGMTMADLNGADFVGFDTPPALEIAPGEEVTVPVFVSHYSQRRGKSTLRWQIVGTDTLGQPVTCDPEQRPATWKPYQVTFQTPLRLRVPSERPFVGALALELLDEQDRRIAANFINLIVRRPAAEDLDCQKPLQLPGNPRVEVLGPRLVAVRLDPDDFASFRSDHPAMHWLNRRSKFYACGNCEVKYQVSLPKFIRDAVPTKVMLMAELATKANDELLDWPAVRRPLDYPQTQKRKFPGKVSVCLLDRELWQFELPNDPADARGVLSHYARYQHGSYGYLVRQKADLTSHVALREKLRAGPDFPLVFRTLGEKGGHGLTIFGERLGRYPIDPTLVIETTYDLKRPPGYTSPQAVTVDRLLDKTRLAHGIRTGKEGGHTWRYTTEKPAKNWTDAEMDDTSWQSGKSGFGRKGTPGVRIGTPWKTTDIWLRTQVDMPEKPLGITLRYFHDEDAAVYVNGKQLLRVKGYVRDYQERLLDKSEMALFRRGRNTMAVHCHQTAGGQGVDLGLGWITLD